MIFKDGTVILEAGETAGEAYQLFNKLLLDGELPVLKPIGFKVVSSESAEVASVVDRHSSMLENMIQLSTNVEKLCFLPRVEDGKIIMPSRVINTEIVPISTSLDVEGMDATSSSVSFVSQSKRFDVIGEQYLCHANSNITIRLIVCPRKGWHDMEDNASKILEMWNGEQTEALSYLPLNTYHSLENYIDIYPWFGKGPIRYYLRNGLTDEQLNLLYRAYKEGAYNGD